MTVQEAIKTIRNNVCVCCKEDCKSCCYGIAIECMEEVEQYRALGTPTQILERIGGLDVELGKYHCLGTVEELKEAREKQVAKSPSLEGDGYCPDGNLVYDTWYCPNCDKSYEVDYDDYDYCPKCGQKIDKSVFEEE